jgi:hypothetical protein
MIQIIEIIGKGRLNTNINLKFNNLLITRLNLTRTSFKTSMSFSAVTTYPLPLLEASRDQGLKADLGVWCKFWRKYESKLVKRMTLAHLLHFLPKL